MSFITVEAQPAGEIRHGRHCAGGKPGWKSCERCAVKQVHACFVFWATMGGVPEIVWTHTAERLAWYERKQVKLSPLVSIKWA